MKRLFAFLLALYASQAHSQTYIDWVGYAPIFAGQEVTIDFKFTTPAPVDADMLLISLGGSIGGAWTGTDIALYVDGVSFGKTNCGTGSAACGIFTSASSQYDWLSHRQINDTTMHSILSGEKSGTLVITPHWDPILLGNMSLGGFGLHAARGVNQSTILDYWPVPTQTYVITDIRSHISAPVPEPETFLLMGAGLILLAYRSAKQNHNLQSK